MVDQLSSFADEVTRVAREVGTEGKLGGQAEVEGRLRHVEGPHRQREHARRQPDDPGAEHRRGDDRGRRTATCRSKITVDARGEVARARRTRSTRWSTSCARSRARSRASRARSAPRASSAARREVEGVSRHLEGPHRQRQLHGRQPDQPGAQHRRGDDGGRAGRPLAEDHRRRQGRGPRAEGHDQHDGRPARVVRRRGHARRARGRHRGQARRPGRGRRASAAPGRT